jgi:hypothetical protein
MIRGYGARRAYNQATLQTRAYQTNIPSGIQEPESAECKFIQEKKDELLISLTKYFAKEIEKPALSESLSTIRRQLISNCPSYTSKVGCC